MAASLPALVEGMAPVRDVYRLAGPADFLRRVLVADMAAFDRFHAALTAGVPPRGVTALFPLERVTVATTLPLSTLSA